MAPTNFRNLFQMREVVDSDIEQFYDLMNYVFQVTNADIEELGDDYVHTQKRLLLSACDVIGWFDKQKLVSQVMTYPFEVNIHGVKYAMGGVTGVGTYPEYSGYGLVSSLILESLTRMKERGQTIAYLFPYSIPFYRKKGWEIISDVIDFKVRDTQLPKIMPVHGRTIREDLDHEDIRKVYQQFASTANAALYRDKLAWEERFRWESEDLAAAIYYEAVDTPAGYLFYKVEDEILYIKEMVYLSEDARRGLWNFIRAHLSMVYHVKGRLYNSETLAFLLEDGEIEQRISPYYMGRIVDVKPFLERYPFNLKPGQQIVLHVQDPLLDWNNGSFTIASDSNGQLMITQGEAEPDLSLTIQTLTTMLLSYKRPLYLHKIGRINGNRHDVRFLEKIIPDAVPWFADYF
ncbi:GNAT family N-acetyltransferase [Paenibacillus sp. 1001270B_150601_E10]|uniref:GNAT family N-acetyltransferase n=1 Tax=Paenibacillus sp. 1001270B_150601_E10 TaxID=2787079 RepID=UPI001E3DA73B|nr:GNAT family N-acetyltransferase [Paenibacillus sp. 1001270B_150601_E10]